MVFVPIHWRAAEREVCATNDFLREILPLMELLFSWCVGEVMFCHCWRFLPFRAPFAAANAVSTFICGSFELVVHRAFPPVIRDSRTRSVSPFRHMFFLFVRWPKRGHELRISVIVLVIEHFLGYKTRWPGLINAGIWLGPDP